MRRFAGWDLVFGKCTKEKLINRFRMFASFFLVLKIRNIYVGIQEQEIFTSENWREALQIGLPIGGVRESVVSEDKSDETVHQSLQANPMSTRQSTKYKPTIVEDTRKEERGN